MRHTRLRKLTDDLYEVTPLGRLRRSAIALAVIVLAFPAALVLLLALLAVLPVLVLAIPPAVLGAAGIALWSAYGHRLDRGHGAVEMARRTTHGVRGLHA
jgi:hypothetical protein